MYLRVTGLGPVALLGILLAACSSGPGPELTVDITTGDVTFDALGDTAQMNAVALGIRARELDDVIIMWSSSDPSVATVDANGLVTARGNGRAVIYASTSNGARGTARVEVEQVPVALEISPADWPTSAAWIGARRQFTVAATDANGFPIDDPAVEWLSSDATVVAVDDTGLATAMDDGSDVVISVQAAAASDFVTATVPPDVADRPGYMYTIYFGRTDIAPALLVNGGLRVPNHVLGALSYEDPAPPWPHALPGQWTARNTIEKFQWEGNRIGLLTDVANGAGTFRALDRAGEWENLVIGTATDFQLEGNRIGVTRVGGELRVKDGIHGTWTVLVAGGAAAFQLEGNRIGVLNDAGELRVKDGIGGPWLVQVDSGAEHFQLAGDRIGVLNGAGEFRVKDGPAEAWTVLVAAGASSFRLAGDRIAVLEGDGTFRVKDGINGAWTVLATEPIRQYALEGNRIGILFESGVFQVKDGINGAWTVLASADVREFQFQGNRIGILREDGVLRIKSGIFGAWDETGANGTGVTQFRLKVDVPVPPYRTTTALYDQKQAECIAYVDDDTNEDDVLNDCYHVSAFAIPVAYYGWYCGGGRPEDFQDIIRDTNYILDSFDAICRHHDTVGSWYPGADDIGGGNFTASCIVRYGLRHGRLTRNGGLLANGYSDQDTWDDAWSGAGMFNLKDALDNYFTYTAGCTESDLADFDAEFRSHP